MNNLLSYCGLVDAKVRASKKLFTCNLSTSCFEANFDFL
jgi:hypothetical protein